MAPKRVRPSQEREEHQIQRTMPFIHPASPGSALTSSRGWVADKTNEHSATLLLDAKETGPHARLDVPIFVCFLMAGVFLIRGVPIFSASAM
jgi:hypothetical protein